MASACSWYAGVVELVYTHDLKSCAERHAGSNPAPGTESVLSYGGFIMAVSSNRSLITQNLVLKSDHATVVAMTQAYARLQEQRSNYERGQHLAEQRWWREQLGLRH
jgi:hypothetical protein